MTVNSKFFDWVTTVIHHHHYSHKTEKAYLDWIYRYVFFHDKKSISEMGEREISEFLNFLALEKRVSASTQNQALNALVFLYKKVLHKNRVHFDFEHIKSRPRLPVVLSHDEVGTILDQLKDETFLTTALLYGSGLRLNECFELRIKDIDFEHKQIMVRGGKEEKGRQTLLPIILIPFLKNQVEISLLKWNENILVKGFSGVFIPEVIARKHQKTSMKKAWQYLFPAKGLSVDACSKTLIQKHRLVSFLQKAIKRAVKKTGITKDVSPHTFRHSFAVRLLENGYDIRMVQKLLGHKNIRTTKKYSHVVDQIAFNVRSPLDIQHI